MAGQPGAVGAVLRGLLEREQAELQTQTLGVVVPVDRDVRTNACRPSLDSS